MKNRSFRNNKGFSLIELIVVVLIMAILASGAIIAISSIYSTKIIAVTKGIGDAMKQARVNSLALENADYGGPTDVYAKVYTKNSKLFIDVCKTEGGDEDTETVLKSHELGSDLFKIKFYEVKEDLTFSEFADISEYTVYVYFKKSTGGISCVRKKGVSTTVDEKSNDVKKISVINTVRTDDDETLILVNVSGRCYLDN